MKKKFLKVLQSLLEKTCASTSFLNKVYLFIKRETPGQVFSCEFCKIFENIYFDRTPMVAASVRWVLKSTQDYYQTHKTTSLKILHKRLIYESGNMLILFAFLEITASDCSISDNDAKIITIAIKLCQGISMSDWPCQRFFQILIWNEIGLNSS